MTVFSIALVLAAPFVLKAQSSVLDLRSDSNAVAVQNTLNNIEVAADTVSAAGEPATRTFQLGYLILFEKHGCLIERLLYR